VFARTKKFLSGFVRDPFEWFEIGGLVRSVTKRLLLAQTAGAPEVGFSLPDFNKIGFAACDRGSWHGSLSE